jgi:site-specific recombinase XerD
VRRNFSPMTIRSYLHAVEVFQQYLGKPLEEAGPDDIRHHQVYLLEDRKLAKGTVVIHVSALRFLYVRVLRRREMKEDLPYPKCRKRLPVVLGREEVAANATSNHTPHRKKGRATSSIQPKISFYRALLDDAVWHRSAAKRTAPAESGQH